MNATQTTHPRLDIAHDEQHEHGLSRQKVRRVGMIDRAALHLGIALIKWGRRPDAAPLKHERLANRTERTLARVAAESRHRSGREYALMLNMR